MELLAVIHHPQTPVRPADELAGELADVYDRAMQMRSQRRSIALPHATVILLRWGASQLGFDNWHEHESGTLATAGLPLLYAPPHGTDSRMISPSDLAHWIGGGQGAAASELGHCGGYFAAANVTGSGLDARVRLVTNYLAEVPLYRASAHQVTVWSNKAAAAAMLAGLPPRLHEDAARQFILLSHCLDNQTLWEGVELEPPGAVIDLDSAACRRRSYLQLPADYFAHDQPTEQIAASCVAQMAPLIEALKARPSRIHLSGGQDSRAVAAMCVHFGFRPACLTFHAPNEEIPSARRLARRLGLEYHTDRGEVATLDAFERNVEPSLWQTDGLMSLKYLAGKYDVNYIRDHDYSPIEGLGGEYGRAYYFGYPKALAKVESGDFSTVFSKAIGGRQRWWPVADDIDRIRDRIQSYLADARDFGLNHFQTTTWFYVNQKMRRWATARRNVGWKWTIDPLQMPCWTYRGMSAAPQDQTQDRLILALIEAAYPGATSVPTVPQLAYRARYRRVATNRIVRNLFKLYDRLKRPTPMHVWDRSIDAHRQAFIDRIRESGAPVNNIVTAGVVDRWLDERPWDYLQTELFWHVLTLAEYCRVFVHAAPAIRPCVLQAASVGAGNG